MVWPSVSQDLTNKQIDDIVKITFVLAVAGLDGGVRVVAEHARQLQNRGHDVVVVSLPKKKPKMLSTMKSWFGKQQWLSSQKLNHSYFDDLDINHIVLERHRPVVNNDLPDADIVIATLWKTAVWVSTLDLSKGEKLYFIQHNEPELFPEQKVEAEETWRLPMKKVVVAKWIKDILIDQYNSDNVVLVPNSVNTEQFWAPPRGKQKIPTVGMMYSKALWKGSDIAIDAYKLAKKEIPDLKLVAFGHWDPTTELPLPEETEFYKQPLQNQIKNIYGQCDAWLFCSRTEGFGLPILEAMACRTPVIGSTAGAAPELIAGNRGILIQNSNVESFAQAILEVCRLSDNEWREMSDRCYAYVRNYTWEDAGLLFENVLEEITRVNNKQ